MKSQTAAIDALLRLARAQHAEALVVQAGQPPELRIGGGRRALSMPALAPALLEAFVQEIVPPERIDGLTGEDSLEVGYSAPAIGEFTVRLQRQGEALALEFRAGGTANNYLPLAFPAVPNFWITTAIIEAAKTLDLKVHVGLGSAGDAFYAPRDPSMRDVLKQSGIVSGEMESDTLYVLAAYRGWRAGALYANDGTSKATKPEWCADAFRKGEENAIRIGIEAMKMVALADGVGKS